ncbi:MAG: metallophosphoesterase [Rhodospirillales bacterium]|nr:metallophosphoesterase [Rhodospirillales bacterium]
MTAQPPIRVAVMSDLHLEAGAWAPPPVAADLVVLAGDVAHGADGVAWAAAAFPDRPVVYVAGNHEHWGDDLGATRRALAAAAAATANVRFLDAAAADFTFAGRSLRVLGATLWTDFRLLGAERMPAVMGELAAKAPDFRHIGLGNGGRLEPWQVALWHRRARRWLEAELAAAGAAGRATLVVTHHAPSPRSLKPGLATRPSACGAASDLEELILRHQPPLWIHGHTHHDADYRLGATRILSRQRGGPANEAFAPLLVEL